MPHQTTEVDKPIVFTDTVISCSASLPATSAGPMFNLQPTEVNVNVNAPITTTVYDAQATNLNGGNADEGITYSIKGTNADKFSITTATGILTYKPLTSPAVETEWPLSSFTFLPLIAKPLVKIFTDTVISCSVSLPVKQPTLMVAMQMKVLLIV
jgi:hypothetical protein